VLPRRNRAAETAERPDTVTVPAVEHALIVVERLVAAHGPIGVSELARGTSIPKSTCFGILQTLGRLGYATQLPDKSWTIGLRIVLLGLASGPMTELKHLAEPLLHDLAERFRTASHLAVYDRGEVVYVAKAESARMIRFDTYPGKRARLHLTALGKALAAHLPAAELEFALRTFPLGAGRDHAIKTREQLDTVLADVRERGHAVEWEEEEQGICCVAVPILLPNGDAIAALGITALTSEVPEERLEEIRLALHGAASELGHASSQVRPRT